MVQTFAGLLANPFSLTVAACSAGILLGSMIVPSSVRCLKVLLLLTSLKVLPPLARLCPLPASYPPHRRPLPSPDSGIRPRPPPDRPALLLPSDAVPPSRPEGDYPRPSSTRAGDDAVLVYHPVSCPAGIVHSVLAEHACRVVQLQSKIA